MSGTTPVGLMPAPLGVIPDFNIHHITATQVSFISAYSATLGLASLTLGMRLYTRFCVTHAFGWDDSAMLIAMGFSVAYFIVCIKMMQYGFGRHLWEVTASQLSGYLGLVTPLVATYAWAPAFTKFSILLLFHRLVPSRPFRIAVYGTAFMIFAYTLIITLVIAIPCSPTASNTGTCLNRCGLWQAILNIITDAVILILPLHMLYGLNLPLRQKLVLSSVFSTGIFVIAICIVRITYIMSLQNNPDVTYSQCRTAVWSSVEINIGIFCNTVIVLKPFMQQFFPSFFASYANSASHPTPGATHNRSGKHSQFSKFGTNEDRQLAYVLGSIDREDRARVEVGGPGAAAKSGAGIVVTNSYKINSSKETDSESTEDILAPSRKIRGGHYSPA